jgi:hypothetical protein
MNAYHALALTAVMWSGADCSVALRWAMKKTTRRLQISCTTVQHLTA